MMDGIRMISIKIYVAFVNAVKKIKDDERGLSGIVVAILLILVAVLAVIFFWEFPKHHL